MKDLPGLYRRGRIYWYAKQSGGRGSREFVSLQTAEFMEAVRKVQELNRDPLQAGDGP